MKNICKDPANARLKLEFYLAFVHNKGRQDLSSRGDE